MTSETGLNVFPDGVWVLLVAAGICGSQWPLAIFGHFGFQRGDYIEAIEVAPQEAWLWFYASGPLYEVDRISGVKEKLFGLDILETLNGEIRPDGAPDGIILLLKLKEGKVIELVKKYD